MRKLLFVACAAAFSSVSFGQLIMNGDFELGPGTPISNVPDWTTDAFSAYLGVFSGVAHSGTYALRLGALAADGDAIHQVIAGTTSGSHYTLSFWSFQGGGDATNSAVHIQWNGTDLYNAPVAVGTTANYTQYSFAVTAIGNDRLDVKGWNSPSFDYLDDIALTPVPEPASIAVLGIGALTLLRRRRK